MSWSETDRLMMDRCFELAGLAAAAGNHPVGSVVAVGGRILGEAEEEWPNGPLAFAHSELLALQRAIGTTGEKRLPAATLYSSHEPCLLCSYALRATGVGRVVIAEPVPEIGGVTSSYPILTAEDVSIWGKPPLIQWFTAGKGNRQA